MSEELEWWKSRVRVWKTYSMMAWQAKRKAEKELLKEKQRNLELKRKIMKQQFFCEKCQLVLSEAELPIHKDLHPNHAIKPLDDPNED